jgi:hypothetical protein
MAPSASSDQRSDADADDEPTDERQEGSQNRGCDSQPVVQLESFREPEANRPDERGQHQDREDAFVGHVNPVVRHQQAKIGYDRRQEVGGRR